jgi:hypothetical protein
MPKQQGTPHRCCLTCLKRFRGKEIKYQRNGQCNKCRVCAYTHTERERERERES